MSVIRVAARKRFATVDRDTVNDSRLSFKARGILIWLLDKPDDWETTAERIEAQGTEGREAVRSALRELETHGYLTRSSYRDSENKWRSEWTVNETGDRKPYTGSRRREPAAGKPSTDIRRREPVTPIETETDTEIRNKQRSAQSASFPDAKDAALRAGLACEPCNSTGLVEIAAGAFEQCADCRGNGFVPERSKSSLSVIAGGAS